MTGQHRIILRPVHGSIRQIYNMLIKVMDLLKKLINTCKTRCVHISISLISELFNAYSYATNKPRTKLRNTRKIRNKIKQKQNHK